MVRFDQPAEELGDRAPNQVPKETVEVIRGLDGFNQRAKDSREEALDQAPIEPVEALMDLDGEQQDAVGTYWKSMRQSRKRKEPILRREREEKE